MSDDFYAEAAVVVVVVVLVVVVVVVDVVLDVVEVTGTLPKQQFIPALQPV